MKPRLEGDTNLEKLDTIRRALGPVAIRDYDEKDDGSIPIPVDIDDVRDTWDCETILSRFFLPSYAPPHGSFVHFAATYSNLENHPRLIRVRDTKAVQKITLDPKTGLPTPANLAPRKKLGDLSEEDDARRMSFASANLTSLTSDQL